MVDFRLTLEYKTTIMNHDSWFMNHDEFLFGARFMVRIICIWLSTCIWLEIFLSMKHYFLNLWVMTNGPWAIGFFGKYNNHQFGVCLTIRSQNFHLFGYAIVLCVMKFFLCKTIYLQNILKFKSQYIITIVKSNSSW